MAATPYPIHFTSKVVSSEDFGNEWDEKEMKRTWIKENVLPEIVTDLIANKQAIIDEMSSFSKTIATKLTESISATIEENFSKSYSRKKIIDAMLG